MGAPIEVQATLYGAVRTATPYGSPLQAEQTEDHEDLSLGPSTHKSNRYLILLVLQGRRLGPTEEMGQKRPTP